MTGNSGHASSSSASQAEKRREFSKRQNLRRQVFREMTTFQIFPLQAMAVDDFVKRLGDYLDAGVDDKEDTDSDRSECTRRVPRQMESGAKSYGDDDGGSSTDCDYQLRQQFKREFLIEKSIKISTVVVAEEKRQDHIDVATDGKQASIGEADYPTQCQNSVEVHCASGAANSNDNDLQQRNLSLDIQINRSNVTKPESVVASNLDHPSAQTSQVRPHVSTLWSMEPRVFAMETSVKGKRRYISAHLGRFMDHYWRECDVYSRHYYELIKENAPCRLYFDLEFQKLSNPQLIPTSIEDFLTQLFDELRHQFQLTYSITIKRSSMVDLDASTPAKFSRHWILHLPNGELFSDAREVGIFVKAFVSRLEEEQASGELQSRGHDILAENLFVNAESGSDEVNPKKLTRIIDLGVYTRNRIFRLMGSTKFGKPTTSALRIAEANEFPFPSGFNNTKFYLPEMGQSPSDCDDIAAVDNDDFEKFCNSLSWEDHADAMAATLVVPPNASKLYFPLLKDPSVIFLDGDASRPNNNTIVPMHSLVMLKFPRATQLYGSSPFPVLERFILENLGKRSGVVGRISTWSIGTQQPLPRTVCFNMKDNRFCDNIGRAHKSNNIIWNVHLGDRVCWQGCHDPECKGFRGNSLELSEEVNIEIDEYFLEYELSLLIEDEVVACQQDDKSLLESEMSKLVISPVQRSGDNVHIFDDESLDNELAQINLSELVTSHRLVKESFSFVKSENEANPPTITETVAANSHSTNSSELWTRDDDIDLELIMLNLSEFESIECGERKL